MRFVKSYYNLFYSFYYITFIKKSVISKKLNFNIKKIHELKKSFFLIRKPFFISSIFSKLKLH